jgi:hypothetical protein
MPQLGASLLMTLEVSLIIVFCSQSRPLALKSKKAKAHLQDEGKFKKKRKSKLEVAK